MLCIRIIPCLDVSNGRVVKGVKFQGLRDAGDPAELAAEYEAQGADELVFLDVSATPEGRDTQVETVRAVRERVSIPITVGGGVRSVDDARALLEAGADKVSMNSAPVRRPELIDEVAEQFGVQCTVVAIDAKRTSAEADEERVDRSAENAEKDGFNGIENSVAASYRGGWSVVISGGREDTGKDALDWAEEAVRRGAGELLVTSWDRDGTREGYDLELLEAISRRVNVPVIASGGASGPRHLVEALDAGAAAVLAASIFHDGDMTVADVKRGLVKNGVHVRI